MSNSVQEQALATVFARYDRRVMNNIHRADYVECRNAAGSRVDASLDERV